MVPILLRVPLAIDVALRQFAGSDTRQSLIKKWITEKLEAKDKPW